MTDDTKHKAWRRLCSQLEPLGIDPYAPQVTPDDSRHEQVQVALTEYKVAIGQVVPVPPGWEGHPPLRAMQALADLDAWLNEQWSFTLSTELGGEAYKADALEQAARAVRNGFRVLAWLGVEDRPERPLLAETLAVAKEQLDALERWVRQKVKEGWTPTKSSQPEDASPDPTSKRRKRVKAPDDYEVNILIKRYLDQHPKATIRDVAGEMDLSTGKVSEMDAWRREMARRKAAKRPAKKDSRPLTGEMLACIRKEDSMDDVDARIDAEEAVWRRLIEQADEQKRAELFAMTKQQKKALIETAVKQYADRLTEEGG